MFLSSLLLWWKIYMILLVLHFVCELQDIWKHFQYSLRCLMKNIYIYFFKISVFSKNCSVKDFLFPFFCTWYRLTIIIFIIYVPSANEAFFQASDTSIKSSFGWYDFGQTWWEWQFSWFFKLLYYEVNKGKEVDHTYRLRAQSYNLP